MGDFTFQMTGGFILGGICKQPRTESYYAVKFGLNSIAYDCGKAASKGKMDRVVIKKIKVLSNRRGILYTDTFNGLWREEDLCTFDEALALALAYETRRALNARALLNRC